MGPDGTMTGGLLRGIEDGWFMAEIAEAAFGYQQKLEKGDKKVVGVNCYTDTVEQPVEILRVSHEVEHEQVRELARRRTARDQAAVTRRWPRCWRRPASGENMIGPILDARRPRPPWARSATRCARSGAVTPRHRPSEAYGARVTNALPSQARAVHAAYHTELDAGQRSALLSWLAFTATFTAVRGITWSIRVGKGPLRNLSVGGEHLHHYMWGIGLLTGVGAVAVRGDEAHRRHPAVAVSYGSGLALIIDEFALLLDLKDVYWAAGPDLGRPRRRRHRHGRVLFRRAAGAARAAARPPPRRRPGGLARISACSVRGKLPSGSGGGSGV